MNLDAPDSRVFEDLMGIAYENHPVRIPILGTSQTIREITPEILNICHRAFYAPGNMMLCVVGDVEPNEVCAIAREVLGEEKREIGEKHNSWPEKPGVLRPETRSAMEVAMPTFSLMFKCPPLPRGDGGILTEMVADLAAEALFGESSELYLKLYEQGIVDSSFGGGFETIDGCAMLLCSGDSDDPPAIREALLAQAERICREGIDEQRFLRMKRSALGRRIRELDSFDSTCFRLCAYYFSDFDYFDFPRIYQGIEREQVCRFLENWIRRDNCCLSVITPLDWEEQT